jgi:hypothetical protein
VTETATVGCPINDSFLPQNMRKHVDPKAPVPLRMMAAKGLVPLSASDMVGVLFMLTFDAEASIREAAESAATKLADRIAASAFRDESVQPPVLGYFCRLFGTVNEAYAEMLILNSSTPDEAVAAVAALCSKRTAEIIAQNQLRLLRHDALVRELAKNSLAQGALIDGVCDFAVRSGLVLVDVPQMQAARIRVFGPDALQKPIDTGPTAEEVMEEFEVRHDSVVPLEEGKKLTLSQRVGKMNIAEKIKLATKGNKEARSILIRDSNRLVCVAVIRSPRLTDPEVLVQAQNRVANEDVLRVIYSNREWLRQYPIKLALIKNPKVPQAISMRMLNQLHESDVKNLARDKNVPGTIQMMAKKMLSKKDEKKKDH